MLERGPSIQNASVLQMRNGLCADQRQDALDPAALVEKLAALVRNDDPRTLAIGEMRFDPVGEPVDVDDRRLDAVLGQPIETMVDQRPSADLDQRLRQRLGDRAHALAETRSEHHGRFRYRRAHVVPFLNAAPQGAGGSGSGPSARGRWF